LKQIPNLNRAHKQRSIVFAMQLACYSEAA